MDWGLGFNPGERHTYSTGVESGNFILMPDTAHSAAFFLSCLRWMTNKYKLRQEEFVEFSPDAIKTFSEFRQFPDSNEAGGILLGRVYPKSHVSVEVATKPHQLDKPGRDFFDRSRGPAQRIVNKAWKITFGERVYLGEWHTHRQLNPVPSARDRKMIRNMFHQTRMQIDFLLLIVVGIEDWVGIENGISLKRLHPFLPE